MPILNYTTSINADKTVGEIQKILARAGASDIAIKYANGNPVALAFSITVEGRAVAFRLPARWQGVLKRMDRDSKVARRLVTEDHALRVCWRILKDWLEAQLAIIDAEAASLAEVFLPYAVTKDGSTLFDAFVQNGMPLLPAPMGD